MSLCSTAIREWLQETLVRKDCIELYDEGVFAWLFANYNTGHVYKVHKPTLKDASIALNKREVEILRKLALLEAPCIVEYITHTKVPYEVLHDDNINCITMKYVYGYNLENYCATNAINDAESWNIGENILRAISFLHSNGIMHRDIKPANIIYNPLKRRATLVDFGFATLLSDASQTAQVGSPVYLDLDVVKILTQGKRWELEPGYVDSLPKIDIWAFGASMYHIYRGQLPYDIPLKVNPYNYMLDNPIDVANIDCIALRYLVRQCMVPMTVRRSASELYKTFFSNFK